MNGVRDLVLSAADTETTTAFKDGELRRKIFEANVAGKGLSQPWYATLLSAGTARRSDAYGGGKTPEETAHETRKRFASGSFRKLVPAVRHWSADDVRRDILATLAGSHAASESLSSATHAAVLPHVLRMRKIVAAPNTDTFLLARRGESASSAAASP